MSIRYETADERDERLHEGNRLAHEGMEIVERFLGTQGEEHVAAFRDLKEKAREYRRLRGEAHE